jgi:hypothetical protein
MRGSGLGEVAVEMEVLVRGRSYEVNGDGEAFREPFPESV